MTRFFLLTATALLLFSCGMENNEAQKQFESGDPVVTAEAAEVTMSSALLYGFVNTEYLLSGGECGFIVSTSSTPSLDNGQRIVSSEVDMNGKYFVQVTGLTSSSTYYYKAFLNTGTTNLVGEIKSFTTKEFEFAAVDLGLSVKWANANLGATTPEGYGDYYAWGETETKENYSWETYKWYDSAYKITKYNGNSTHGTVDNITELQRGEKAGETIDDVARKTLGGKWRMPNRGEMEELVSTLNNASYQWEWKSLNGHNGWLVTYLVNNNSIFLPAAGYRGAADLIAVGSFGYYWSSALLASFPRSAWLLYFHLQYVNSVRIDHGELDREYGLSIRPVLE